jgi:hypothetical protein
MRLPMKVEPLEVKLEGWEDNVIKVTPTNLKQREWKRTNMSLSTQRHGNVYKCKEILHMH